MIRPSCKFLILGVALAGALLLDVPQADAHWWRWGPPVSSCYSPCWTSCDPCCGPGWVLGWRPGPVRRLLFGRYRWYPASWSSWDCCVSGAWEPCCTEVATVTSAPMIQQEERPTLAPKPAETPSISPSTTPLQDFEKLLEKEKSAPALPKKSATPGPVDQTSRADSGLLSVSVPTAARVYINGRETQSMGSRREYVSYGLKEGKIYPYTVRALVLAKDAGQSTQPQEDRWVWITKTVYLRAGDRAGVTFSDNLELESQQARVEPAGIR